MSIKKTTETTSSKILNSDIYDITRFVDDIKKKNIDGIDSSKETLLVGMYGYLGYQFSSLLQNAIVTASELSNEAIPTRAKFDRNVITHALSLGVKKVSATAANMNILLMIPEKALRANMIDGKFVLKASTPLAFDEYEFHLDYDIEINYVSMLDSTNGSQRNYVYTAKYLMDNLNPISDISNPFLPPLAIFNYLEDNMVVLATNIHQVYYREIYEKILTSDIIASKTISFSFEKQMSHFTVEVTEPTSSDTSDTNVVPLVPVYDGLYNQEIAELKYCYYQYINPNTIRIRFDPTNYQPPANSDITIKLYTTDGAGGNFEYSEEKTIRITSNEYTNLYCIVAQRDDEGSHGGLDRQSIEELQHIIPKEALSRGSVTTNTDLSNYFNSFNNESSVLHVFKKEDDILRRVYYTYNLMKDSEYNVVPTNTLPIFISSKYRDSNNGKIYLESGTPIYYYKFGEGTDLALLQNNYIGYTEQKVTASGNNYYFNDTTNSMYQGTPTQETIENWFENYNNSFDPDKDMGIAYKLIPGKEKPSDSYDFYRNASVYFKPFYNSEIDWYLHPNGTDAANEGIYDKWYFGTCVNCSLKRIRLTLYAIIQIMRSQLTDTSEVIKLTDFELEFKDGSITTHYPMRPDDTVNPATAGYITVDSNDIISTVQSNLSGVSFYRPYYRTTAGILESVSGYCVYPLIYTEDTDTIMQSNIDIYVWLARISFYDESGKFAQSHSSGTGVTRNFIVPDYIVDLNEISTIDKTQFAIRLYNSGILSNIDPNQEYLMLEGINTVNAYSYDGQPGYSYDDINLTEGDLIRFDTYRLFAGSDPNDRFSYMDPSTWNLGEVLSIDKTNGRITSIEVLMKDEELGNFDSVRYRLPLRNETTLDTNCITLISILDKFLYTTPLSIILKDSPSVNSHRITASYYLDIIDETRYQEYTCVNSKSPIQFILSNIHTYRSSYLSDNRYKYTISINIKPNTNQIDQNMINRTQVIGVFYKKNESGQSRPIMYSIAKYQGLEESYIDENGNEVTRQLIADEKGIHYEITLFSKPFSISDTTDIEDDNYRVDVVDDENNVYIGSKKIVSDIIAKYTSPSGLTDEEAAIEEFFKEYKMFNADSNYVRPLSIEDLPDDFNLNTLSEAYVNTIYLNLNTELKIYVLYKYDASSNNAYTDGLAKEYLSVNTSNAYALYNSVSPNTMFTQTISVDPDDPDYIEDYSLKQMTLTNVYNTYNGINLLYDYSNVMDSYVSAIKTKDPFDSTGDTTAKEAFIINRVPCVRYFYWNTEERVLTFLKDMKSKINYVLESLTPLETTFGIDYKFFNTYGPSNMYHLTNDDGDVTDLIDNVALTMTFRAKFYNEDTDAGSIIDPIKNTIKDYLEKLDQLDDIHFPNITTLVESEYSEYLIYFEFVSFNIYDATTQHIITDENMEMLSVVPEFLHVDTNDWNGKPYINIRIVTS